MLDKSLCANLYLRQIQSLPMKFSKEEEIKEGFLVSFMSNLIDRNLLPDINNNTWN